MSELAFQFEWDEKKTDSNIRKHGVSFEQACTVFRDPRVLTVADLEHSEAEERWFSVGCASNGAIVAIVYIWSESDFGSIQVRLISARGATRVKISYYREGLWPAEIDFSRGVRGRHHIPANAKVFVPTSIERSVWEYFSAKLSSGGLDCRNC